jgi:hypothetical protein
MIQSRIPLAKAVENSIYHRDAYRIDFWEAHSVAAVVRRKLGLESRIVLALQPQPPLFKAPSAVIDCMREKYQFEHAERLRVDAFVD